MVYIQASRSPKVLILLVVVEKLQLPNIVDIASNNSITILSSNSNFNNTNNSLITTLDLELLERIKEITISNLNKSNNILFNNRTIYIISPSILNVNPSKGIS